MNNREKAREIALDFGMSDFTVAKEAADEMAEWKDQQFKEYLEKKVAEYMSQRCDANMWSEQWAVSHALACTMRGIINELFGETKTNTDREE